MIHEPPEPTCPTLSLPEGGTLATLDGVHREFPDLPGKWFHRTIKRAVRISTQVEETPMACLCNVNLREVAEWACGNDWHPTHGRSLRLFASHSEKRYVGGRGRG